MFTGDVFEAELVGEMFFEPMLDLQDDHVLVQLLPTEPDTPRRIAALHLVKDVAGHGLRHVRAAEAFDQIDVEITGRGGAAGAIEVIGIGQVLVLIQIDLGKALGKGVEETPVGGRFLAIEQAGFGEPEHSRGFTA